MDETAKTEARNYLSAAGFFLLGADFLLNLILLFADPEQLQSIENIDILTGIGLVLIAVLLIILRKRDMLSILFTMLGFSTLFCGFVPFGFWYIVTSVFVLLTVLVTLTGKDKQKWFMLPIPVLCFILYLILVMKGYNLLGYDAAYVCAAAIGILLTVLSLYYAFACASERIALPGRNILTADEETDFKASGSVLCYILFAFIITGWAIYNIAAESLGLPIEPLQTLEFLCAVMQIIVAVLLFAVAKMRFTPVMFLLIALTTILGICSSGMMTIGLGILFLCIALYAILRKESRILPGIMLLLYSAVFFIMGGSGFGLPALAIGILEIITAAISVYLAFVVYSQKNLPKF